MIRIGTEGVELGMTSHDTAQDQNNIITRVYLVLSSVFKFSLYHLLLTVIENIVERK